MGGENSWSGSVQPGGRPPAPGTLALVQSFINSHYDLEVEHGADLLGTPAQGREWLQRNGLLDADAQLAERDLSRLRRLREGLRTLASVNGDAVEAPGDPGAAQAVREQATGEINEVAGGTGVELRFGAGGPIFLAAAPGGPDGAIGLLLALTACAMLDGSWTRLKVCPGEDCGWAFYDHSRNGTGRWCSMAVCGGRAKARAHYRRKRGSER